MLVDDYWESGLKQWFTIWPGVAPRVVEVPFPVGLEVRDMLTMHNGETDVGVRMRPISKEDVGRFLPETLDEHGDTTIDITFARPPYPRMIIIDQQRKGVVVFQEYTAGDGYLNWFMAAVTRAVDSLMVYPAVVQVDGNRLRYSVDQRMAGYRDFLRGQLLLLNPKMRDAHARAISGMLRLDKEDVDSTVSALTMECTATFALLNCRNVVQEEVLPTRADRRRAHRSRLPAFSYHVLKIAPMSEIKRAARTGTPIDPKYHVGLHWQRGHFKTFTVERPLFGRVIGRFWWQPHLAGRNKKRFVDKDYQIDVEAK